MLCDCLSLVTIFYSIYLSLSLPLEVIAYVLLRRWLGPASSFCNKVPSGPGGGWRSRRVVEPPSEPSDTPAFSINPYLLFLPACIEVATDSGSPAHHRHRHHRRQHPPRTRGISPSPPPPPSPLDVWKQQREAQTTKAGPQKGREKKNAA